jgi:hypothetical protein
MSRIAVLLLTITQLLLLSCASMHNPATVSFSNTCFRLETGSWCDEKKVLIADPCRLIFKLRKGGQVHLVEYSHKGSVPYIGEVGGWSQRHDEIEVWWGTGLVVTTMNLRLTGRSIEGKGRFVTDTGLVAGAVLSGTIAGCP